MENSYQGIPTSDRHNQLPADPVMQAAGRVRIGDLLADAGLVSMEVIQRALGTFEEHGLPVGKMLVNSGFITEGQLKSALEIQNVINNGQLPRDVGTSVLTLCFAEKIPLAESFEKAGIVQPQDHLSNKLGQILLDSGVVTAAALDQALEVNHKIGLPLGHILCYRGLLSQQLLETSLLGQQLVRRASISREQCLKAIAQAYSRECALEVLPVNQGYKRSLLRSSARIGELLFEAQLVDDNQLLEALQVSLATARPAGECLSEICKVPPAYIEAAVELQEMLDNNALTGILAQDTLIRMHGFNLGFLRALAEASVSRHLTNLSSNVLELLILGKIFTTPINELPEEITERLELHYNQAIDVCRLLLAHGLVAEQPLYTALRLVYLQEEEFLSREQALAALALACSAPCSADEALYRMGLKKRTRLRQA